MASASALAGAFTTLGVSANRAAAKKTNVVAKKVRVLEMPSVPNESTRTSTSSFPRVAGAAVAHAPGDLRGSRARSTGDRCRTRDRATRAVRSRTPPIRSGVTIVFFTNRAIPTRGLPTRGASNAR
jgi:hypothetical protein